MVFEAKKVPTHVGEKGDHPLGGAVGAVLGAAGGAAVVGAAQGAAVGSVAGVPGLIAGAGIGTVVGALAGKLAGQDLKPTTEDIYWSENYQTRPYVEKNVTYEVYGPAYRHGVNAYSKYDGKTFDEIEPNLRSDWENARGESTLDWEKAKPATRDAFDRLHNNGENDNLEN